MPERLGDKVPVGHRQVRIIPAQAFHDRSRHLPAHGVVAQDAGVEVQRRSKRALTGFGCNVLVQSEWTLLCRRSCDDRRRLDQKPVRQCVSLRSRR
jgi:hypothetical protein